MSCVLQVSHYERRIRTLEADLRESKEQRKRALDEVLHYKNLPLQYTENFFSSKNLKFHRKSFDIFNIFAQNIDCGYTF